MLQGFFGTGVPSTGVSPTGWPARPAPGVSLPKLVRSVASRSFHQSAGCWPAVQSHSAAMWASLMPPGLLTGFPRNSLKS